MAPVTIARFVQELEKLKQVSDAEKLKPQEYDSRLARIIQELREKGIDADRAATTAALADAVKRGITDQRCGGLLMMSRNGRGTSMASPRTSSRASRGPSFFTWYHAPRRSGRSMSARSRAQKRFGVTASLVSGPPQPSPCLGVVRGPRCADRMRPRWPMPVTIIPLEAAGVLGLLVCHPLGRLVAGAAGHPVVEVAAWFAHRECSDVAPPTSPRRRQRQLHLRHVAVDPHHVVAAHDRIHGIRLARERLPVRARHLRRREVVPASLAARMAVDHAHRPRP